MSKLKVTGIVSVILALIVCLGINAWYFYIRIYSPDKIVSHTFEIGLQTTADGNSNYFMEINSYDDLFEIKFNYLLDENKTQLYSQGLQYYNQNLDFVLSTANFQLENKTLIGGSWLWKDYSYTQYKKYVTTANAYNYMLDSDDGKAPNSTNPLDENSFFKIDLDGEIYGMKLKGLNTPQDETTYLGYRTWKDGVFDRTDHKVNYYLYYDLDLLVKLLYNAISSLPYGTNDAMIFELGDYFDYYEYDTERGIYTDVVNLDKASLLTSKVKSYYSIKVTKNEGNIKKASQSLFNCVAGSPNFNLTIVSSDDYFFGRTLITINNSAFARVKITDTHMALKLKEDFVNTYLPYAEKMYLQILIDLDEFKDENLEFVGFTADSGIFNFKVSSCQSVQTINDELVYSEVAYE